MLGTIRHILKNPILNWHSAEQKTAMIATLNQNSDVIAVLATGGGKSMLAIVPSIMEEATVTILVLLLNSLILDYQCHLTQMQVPYQLYGEVNNNEGQLEITKNPVLVSADKAQTIRSMPMQLVLLSATLPPTFIPELMDSYDLLPNTTIIRQSTNRPELAYILEKMNITSLLTRTIQILSEDKLGWSEEDRGLVFVSSIADGQKLVDLTNHAFYCFKVQLATGMATGNWTGLDWSCNWTAVAVAMSLVTSPVAVATLQATKNISCNLLQPVATGVQPHPLSSIFFSEFITY
ncbi:hypothetical protein EV363DRAFT_1294613 [Boletus edulis]|nr:hypothetical protein EV363DRAFT_1294613 [Boletus edulis]